MTKKITLKDIKKAKQNKPKRERADSKKNTAKVIKTALNNPLDSQATIAKKAWVAVGTVNAKLNQLESVDKDPRIKGILDADLEMIVLWQWIISERFQDEEEKKKISARDVSGIIKENTARYTLFAGNATDDKWGLNAPILELDTDKLLLRLKELNDKKAKNDQNPK